MKLTAREKQVVNLMMAGYGSKTIADRLSISPNTVECHRKRIYKKLGVCNPAQMLKKIYNLADL